MKIAYVYILFCVVAFFGCQEETPDMFSSTRFIQFDLKKNAGEVYYRFNYSFAYELDNVEQKVMKFPVIFKGYDLEKGEHLKFAVEVDREKTTLPAECFQLEREQAFRVDTGCVDTMQVTLLRKPVLKEGDKILRLQLVTNQDFEVGARDSIFVEIQINDVFGRPEWWEAGGSVEKAYLGPFSKKKYKAFIEETGIQDFGALSPSEKRYYAIMFKRALERNPREDEDGNMMSVTITG